MFNSTPSLGHCFLLFKELYHFAKESYACWFSILTMSQFTLLLVKIVNLMRENVDNVSIMSGLCLRGLILYLHQISHGCY